MRTNELQFNGMKKKKMMEGKNNEIKRSEVVFTVEPSTALSIKISKIIVSLPYRKVVVYPIKILSI